MSKDKVGDVTPLLGVGIQARCKCDVRIGNLWGRKACSNVLLHNF